MLRFKKARIKKKITATTPSTELTTSALEQVAGGKPDASDIHVVKQIDKASANLK